MTAAALRQHFALTAAKYCGCQESSPDHRHILALYNSITPLPRGYRVTEEDAWCAAFVSAMAMEAGIGKLVALECSCARMTEKAMQMGIWEERDNYLPKVGDILLYNWDAKDVGDDTGVPDHVGIVLNEDDGTLRVIEGNYTNSVRIRKLAVGDRRIRGYVCPDFGDWEECALEDRYHTLDEVPEYGKDTIEKLIREGSLLGIAANDLDLSPTLVRVLVILDRRGKL